MYFLSEIRRTIRDLPQGIYTDEYRYSQLLCEDGNGGEYGDHNDGLQMRCRYNF
ncbi:MAG: hypothetical protein HDQ95_09290 [Roseburia sp.]|nr:hypothetical protein [Roseburia sp.]